MPSVRVAPAIRRALRKITATDHGSNDLDRCKRLMEFSKKEAELVFSIHPYEGAGKFWSEDSESEVEDLGDADTLALGRPTTSTSGRPSPSATKIQPATAPKTTPPPATEAPTQVKSRHLSPRPTPRRARDIWRGPLPLRRTSPAVTLGDRFPRAWIAGVDPQFKGIQISSSRCPSDKPGSPSPSGDPVCPASSRASSARVGPPVANAGPTRGKAPVPEIHRRPRVTPSLSQSDAPPKRSYREVLMAGGGRGKQVVRSSSNGHGDPHAGLRGAGGRDGRGRGHGGREGGRGRGFGGRDGGRGSGAGGRDGGRGPGGRGAGARDGGRGGRDGGRGRGHGGAAAAAGGPDRGPSGGASSGGGVRTGEAGRATAGGTGAGRQRGHLEESSAQAARRQAALTAGADETADAPGHEIVDEAQGKQKRKRKDQNRVVECAICTEAHFTKFCPLLRGPKPSVAFVGVAQDNYGFFQIQGASYGHIVEPTATPVAALITVEGNVSADLLRSELERIVPVSYEWEVQEQEANTFVVPFPNKDELDRLVKIRTLPTFNREGYITFSEFVDDIQPIKILEKVWVTVTKVPRLLRSFLPLWAVGSVVGATQKVDMVHFRATGQVRIQVAVHDIKEIPKSADICVGSAIYRIFYKADEPEQQGPTEPAEEDEDEDLLDDDDKDKELGGSDEDMADADRPNPPHPQPSKDSTAGSSQQPPPISQNQMAMIEGAIDKAVEELCEEIGFRVFMQPGVEENVESPNTLLQDALLAGQGGSTSTPTPFGSASTAMSPVPSPSAQPASGPGGGLDAATPAPDVDGSPAATGGSATPPTGGELEPGEGAATARAILAPGAGAASPSSALGLGGDELEQGVDGSGATSALAATAPCPSRPRLPPRERSQRRPG